MQFVRSVGAISSFCEKMLGTERREWGGKHEHPYSSWDGVDRTSTKSYAQRVTRCVEAVVDEYDFVGIESRPVESLIALRHVLHLSLSDIANHIAVDERFDERNNLENADHGNSCHDDATLNESSGLDTALYEAASRSLAQKLATIGTDIVDMERKCLDQLRESASRECFGQRYRCRKGDRRCLWACYRDIETDVQKRSGCVEVKDEAWSSMLDDTSNQFVSTMKSKVERKVVNPPDPTTTSSRVLVHVCCCGRCGGWADRLKGAASARVLARLSNRTLRLLWTHPVDPGDIFDVNSELSIFMSPGQEGWLFQTSSERGERNNPRRDGASGRRSTNKRKVSLSGKVPCSEWHDAVYGSGRRWKVTTEMKVESTGADGTGETIHVEEEDCYELLGGANYADLNPLLQSKSDVIYLRTNRW